MSQRKKCLDTFQLIYPAVKKKWTARSGACCVQHASAVRKRSELFLFSSQNILFLQSVTWRTKVHRMQSQSSVLKRLYEREKRLAGKVKWKSRLSHYLLTIHYWIRYTRFWIPIAKSFLRRATVSIRIVSTNKHANIRPRSDLRRLYVCALIRVLEINPTPKGRVGPAGVFV